MAMLLTNTDKVFLLFLVDDDEGDSSSSLLIIIVVIVVVIVLCTAVMTIVLICCCKRKEAHQHKGTYTLCQLPHTVLYYVHIYYTYIPMNGLHYYTYYDMFIHYLIACCLFEYAIGHLSYKSHYTRAIWMIAIY